ncbi:MAG: acylneuraminate cytidylyltransferase family protein, partial [Patescibacteria group bacterium]
MYKNKKILGLITARGSSSSIPKKNIALLAGRPLVSYTIEAAKKSQLLTRTIVSTDNEEISAVAKAHGADVPFQRPAELAQYDTPHIPVVRHALDWLKEQQGEDYDYVMILQPTSPLRTGADIDAAIIIAIDTGADSVMSKVEIVDFDPVKIKRIENDLILPLFADEGAQSARRQSG